MSERRERSLSPSHSSRGHHQGKTRYRRRSRSCSRSPRRSKHSHNKREEIRRTDGPQKPLPLGATILSKHDSETYRPLFALYLDVQKQLDIDDLPEDEVKGRWKSFMKKWNFGDLAEGWYDPKTFDKAKHGTFGVQDSNNRGVDRSDVSKERTQQLHPRVEKEGNRGHGEDDEDDFGPHLPTDVINLSTRTNQNQRAGPAIPSASDIQARNEEAQTEADTARSSYINAIRAERKADRQAQKERLKEIAPRAEPGSRERQLEKKREFAASNQAFAAAKDGGGDVELRDADIMGDEDGLGELKRMKEMEQRKKTEREIRRDEILRTRTAEREERLKGLREKEAKTMDMLKSIAKARFGGSTND